LYETPCRGSVGGEKSLRFFNEKDAKSSLREVPQEWISSSRKQGAPVKGKGLQPLFSPEGLPETHQQKRGLYVQDWKRNTFTRKLFEIIRKMQRTTNLSV